ncbi:Chaperone protein htpG [Granulibacter bethesdensis]|nr:Chaperone protein htpG [Granulibacter bethesdensis]
MQGDGLQAGIMCAISMTETEGNARGGPSAVRGRFLFPPCLSISTMERTQIMSDQTTTGQATAGETGASGSEQHRFGAEVDRLLHLVIHSLYTEREIFLRELVANAADAIERRRFEALSDTTLLAGADEAKIRLSADKAARTLTIADGGIGMTRDDLITHLGTIAKSGTRAFGEALKAREEQKEGAEKPTTIGQFGVGFYAAFMVADRVEVTSRRAGTEDAWTWSSEGNGTFAIAPGSRDTAGTTIVMHIKADADEFLDSWRLENIIRKWADFIAVPVLVAQEDGEDRAANDGAALWRKSKSEVTEEDYEAFYRHVGSFFDKPWATLHWRAEGAIDFSALLFIPGSPGFTPMDEERESRVRLHVKRMFITDRAEILPAWLRFVHGVVDTDDLPLNVSREMLQATPVLARIRKAVTNRVLTELKTRAKDEESYRTFWQNFGRVLKEGVWDDSEHRKDLLPLLRFASSAIPADQDGGLTSLDAYVSRMKEGQKAIYYLAGDRVETLRNSPQLEGFRAQGYEVLLLEDPIDAFWPERAESFADKPIRSVARSAEDLAATEGDVPDVSALTSALKAALGERVSEVRASTRLVSSAVILSSAGVGPDLQMQRLLARAGRGLPPAPPVLEINPRHKLIASLASAAAQGEGEARGMESVAETLLDLARIQEGEAPADPTAFAGRVMSWIEQGLPGHQAAEKASA